MIIAMRRTMIGAVLISVGIYAEKRAEKYNKKNKRWIKKTQRFFLWGAWRSRTALAGFADQRLNRSSNAPDLIERASFSNAMQRYNLFFRTKNEKQRNLSALLLLLIYIKSYSQQAYSVWKWTIAWQFLCFFATYHPKPFFERQKYRLDRRI